MHLYFSLFQHYSIDTSYRTISISRASLYQGCCCRMLGWNQAASLTPFGSSHRCGTSLAEIAAYHLYSPPSVSPSPLPQKVSGLRGLGLVWFDLVSGWARGGWQCGSDPLPLPSSIPLTIYHLTGYTAVAPLHCVNLFLLAFRLKLSLLAIPCVEQALFQLFAIESLFALFYCAIALFSILSLCQAKNRTLPTPTVPGKTLRVARMLLLHVLSLYPLKPLTLLKGLSPTARRQGPDVPKFLRVVIYIL